MINIVGQDELITKINNTQINNLPHSILLTGDKGAGKHLLCNYISEHFNLPLSDITNCLTNETITNIYLTTVPQLYFIDLDSISVKDENTILKFVEEPLTTSYLVLIANSTTTVLPTIMNRCQHWPLKPYAKEILQKFLKSDNTVILDIAKTPGQVIEYDKIDKSEFNQMLDMSYKIIVHIATANFANTLTISDKIAFKDEATKWNFEVFIKLLHWKVYNTFITNENAGPLFTLYELTTKLLNDSYTPHVSKQHLFENFLITAKNSLQAGVLR